VNLRSRILQIFGFTAVLAATPLAAVYYQPTMHDPDIWWRLRVGEFIASTHSFPHMAIFSRFAATNAWETHSWVFDLLVWLVYKWFSLPGLATFLFVFQIAIAGVMIGSLTLISRSWWTGLLLSAVCLTACFHTLAPRAALFTVLLFLLELAMIFHDLRERRVRAMYWLPLIFLVWANCHIQFVNGFVVLGLLCGCELLQHFIAANVPKSSPDLPWSKVLLIFVGCVLATLVNPYSWHLYEIIWGYLTKAGQWDQIVELLAPDFRRPSHYIELLLAGWAAWSLGTRRTHSLFRVVLLAATAIISFHAVREAWMVAIVASFLIAEGEAGTQDSRNLDLATIATAAVFAFALCMAAQARVGFTNAKLIAELDRTFPVRAVSFVADTHPPGPIYNSMNWGGYLIFNLREYPVAIDGRNEAYGGDIGDSSGVMNGSPGWKQDPTFATSNLVLIERNLPLARLLSADPDFNLIYQDHLAMVFVRKPR
jgi:hypothetical protein